MTKSAFLFSARYFYSYDVKVDEMGGASSTNGGGKTILNFSQKTSREGTI